jgi:hypothetical protein
MSHRPYSAVSVFPTAAAKVAVAAVAMAEPQIRLKSGYASVDP